MYIFVNGILLILKKSDIIGTFFNKTDYNFRLPALKTAIRSEILRIPRLGLEKRQKLQD